MRILDNSLLKVLPERRDIRKYCMGFIEGVTAFAWMKDGTYYVGTCGTTLKEVIKWVEEDFKELTGQDYHI